MTGVEESAESEKAEEAAVKDAKNLNEKAYEFAKNDNFGEAIATIDKAINLCPNDPNYYDSKGELLLNMGDKDGAKAMWEKVVSLDPKFSEKKTALYLLLFEPKDIDFESDLNTFEDIGGRIIQRKKGDQSISVSDKEFENFKVIWQKIADNSGYLTLKQQKRALNIMNKFKK